MKKTLYKLLKKTGQRFFYDKFQRTLFQTGQHANAGAIQLYGKRFEYHHGRAFYDTYKEIFLEGIYSFKTTNPNPVIIDCGANMGLSVLYFAKSFPNAKIVAFEPDGQVFGLLKKNIASQKLQNVVLHEKAVWSSETELQFYTDGGMGGRVGVAYEHEKPVKIQTLRLKDFLQQPVDFLKLDIEGAEYEVLKDCDDVLRHAAHIFIEYHSNFDEEQHLEDILSMLKSKGFRYHLRQSFSRTRPFIDNTLACEKFDMAINIFAYR